VDNHVHNVINIVMHMVIHALSPVCAITGAAGQTARLFC
jgi:hypothetical protein